jgi:hypothetical protein
MAFGKDKKVCRYEMCSEKATHYIKWPSGTKAKFCYKHGVNAVRHSSVYVELRKI